MSRLTTLLVFVLAGLAGMLEGAPVRPLALAEIESRALQIVRGTVAGLECSRDSSQRLFTRVTVDVTATFKGCPTNRLHVVHPGGLLGERRVTLLGQPEYSLGEELILFLVPNDRGEWKTVEIGQGRFQVWKDARGQWVAGNGWLGGTPDDSSRGRPPSRVPIPVETLTRQIQSRP